MIDTRKFDTLLVKEGSGIVKVRGYKEVAEAFKDMESLDHEEFRVACLSTRNEIIGSHLVSKGTIDSSLVHPRDVFKCAILSNAKAIILLHNHPSGDSTPSPDDSYVTKKLQKAGEIMGIEVLDHIIIGDVPYSYKDEGLM